MVRDPALPELEHLSTPAGARAALRAFGIDAPVKVDLLSHKPGDRAVLRLRHDGGEVFCKLMRPDAAVAMAEHHRLLRRSGLPVPKVIGYTERGALFITASDGVAGGEAAVRHDPEALLDGVDAVRERLLEVPLTRAARPSPATRIEQFLLELADALPEQAPKLKELSYTLLPTQHPQTGAPVPVHGDLHLGQLFFTGSDVSGVIDVDTAGLGEPANDSANFIAHAIAMSFINEDAGKPKAAKRLDALANHACERWLNSSRERALTAVHLVGFAQRAVQQEAPERAVRLIERAEGIIQPPRG